jgi:GNAT superfamily N-acetyltransferase
MSADHSRRTLTIRSATEADVRLIASFIRQLAEFERLQAAVVATEDSLRETLFGKEPAAEILLAYEGDEPVGFALFFRNYSTFLGRPGLYLEDLFVVPSARGRGVGRRLMHRLAQLAVERGYGRVEWAVLKWNTDAIRFYEYLGAKPMEDWVVYRLTGDLLKRAAHEAEPTPTKDVTTG